MTPIAECPAPHPTEPYSLASDVFHQLSQPLTALLCSLELSLTRDQTLEEFRFSVEAALQNAERLRQHLLLLRELSDADDPGDMSAPVDLQQLLQALQEDLLPVFESAGGHINVECEAMQIRGNAAKLTRSFFYLLGYLERSSPQAALSVGVEKINGRHAEVRMTLSDGLSWAAPSGDLSEPVSAGEVEIARRTFRALGGDLELVESASGQTVWTASLPIAQ